MTPADHHNCRPSVQHTLCIIAFPLDGVFIYFMALVSSIVQSVLFTFNIKGAGSEKFSPS